MVFLKEFLEKVDFEKKQQTTKKHAKLPSMQRVNLVPSLRIDLRSKQGYQSEVLGVLKGGRVFEIIIFSAVGVIMFCGSWEYLYLSHCFSVG